MLDVDLFEPLTLKKKNSILNSNVLHNYSNIKQLRERKNLSLW